MLFGVEPLAILLEVCRLSTNNFNGFERVSPPLRFHGVLKVLGTASEERLVHVVRLLAYEHRDNYSGDTACR
jgi:hypothetical protein